MRVQPGRARGKSKGKAPILEVDDGTDFKKRALRGDKHETKCYQIVRLISLMPQQGECFLGEAFRGSGGALFLPPQHHGEL